jgi:hypothetical protein
MDWHPFPLENEMGSAPLRLTGIAFPVGQFCLPENGAVLDRVLRNERLGFPGLRLTL